MIFFKMTHFSISTFVRKIVQDEEFVPNYERIPKHVWDIFLECHRLAVDKQRQNELKMDDMGIEGLWNEIQEKFPEPQLSDDDYDDEDSDEDDEYYDEDVDDGENKDVDDGEDKDVDDGEDKDVDNGDVDGNGDESSSNNHDKMIVYEKVPNKVPFKLPKWTTVYAYGPNEKNLPLEPLWNYIRLNVPETDDILLRSIPYEAFMEPKPELDELFEAYPSTVWDKELEMDDEILERLVDYLYLIADAKLPAYELELMSCDINDDSKPFPLTELAAKRQRTIQSKQSATETPTKSLSKQPKVEPVKPYSIITRENVFEIISHIIGDITDKKMVPKVLQNRYCRIKRRIAVKRYEEMMEEEEKKTIHPMKKKKNVIWAKPIKVEFDFVPKCTVRWKNPISETIVITKMKRMSTSESRLTRQNPTTSQPEPVSSTNKKYYFTIGHEDDVYDDDETFQPIWIGLESVSATKSILVKTTMQPEILVNGDIKTDDKLIHKEEDPESEHPNACNKIEDVVCGICHDIACEEHVAFKPVKVALLSNEDEDDDDVDDEELEFDEEKDDEDQEERIIKRMMPKPCGLDCFLNIKSVRSFDHIMPESDDGDSDDYNENDEVEVPFAGFWPGDEFHLEIQALNEKNNADLFRHGCIEEIVDTEEKVNVNVLPIEFDSAQDIQSMQVSSPFNKSLDSFAVLGGLEYLFKIPETEIGSPPRDIQPMEVSSPSNKLPPTPSRELRALLGTTQNVSPTKTRKYREIEEPNAVESPRKSSRVRSQLESTRNNKTQIEHRSPIKTVESFDICETENSNVSQMKTGSPTKTGSPLKIGSSNADAVSPKKCTKRDLFSDLRVLLNEINNDEPAKNGSLPDTESSATQDSDIVLTKKTGSPIKIEASNLKSPIKSQSIEAVSPPNKIRRIEPTQANGPSMKISLSPSIVQHIKIDPSLPNNVPKIEDQSNENGSQLADFNPSREIVPKSEYSSPPAKRRRIIPLKGFGPVCSRVPKDNRFTVFMGINLDAYFSLNPETGSTFSILNKLHKLINPKLLNSHLKIKQNLELFNSCMSEFVKRWDSKVNQIGRICENDLMHSSNKNSVTLLECNKHFSEEKKRLLNQEARYRIELEYCEPMIYHIRLVLYNLNRKRNINLEVHRLIDMNTNKVLKKFTFNLMPQKRVPDFDLGQYAYNWLAKTVSLKEYSMADLDDSEMDKIKDNDIRLDHWKCEEMDQFLRFYEQLQGNHCSLRSFLRISGVNKSCAEVFKFMNNVMNSCTSSQKEKVTESKDKVDSYSISVSRSDLNSVSGSNLASGSNGKSKIADEDADLDVENEEYDEDIDDEEFDDELDDEEFDEEIDEELGDEEFAEDGDDDDDDDSYDEEYGSNDESKSKSKSKSANKNGTKKSDNKNKYWEYFAEKLKRITSKQTLPDEDRRIQYTPCNHGNGVCDEECPCVKNDSFCEKFCGCSVTCPERFPGCTCDLPCDKHHCPCVKASRECDPDLCKHCGSGEVDPVDVRCSNVSLQRGWKKRLMTGASDVAGWGCFTLEAAKKDELISEYVGEMISHEEANRRGKLYDIRHCSYLFSLNNKFLLDAKRMGNKIRFANHSSEPNCDARVILVGGYHRVGIYAMHKIEAGEELFFNYGYKAEIGLTFVPLKRVVPKRKSFANREIKKKEASDTEIDLE